MEEMETGLNKWNRNGGDGNEENGGRMEEMEIKEMEQGWRRWK